MAPKGAEVEDDDVRQWSDLIRGIDVRLRVIERLVWTAVGGTAVLWVVALTVIGMLLKQTDRIDSIATRQASAIAERTAQIEAMKGEMERIKRLNPW